MEDKKDRKFQGSLALPYIMEHHFFEFAGRRRCTYFKANEEIRCVIFTEPFEQPLKMKYI